MPAACMGGSCAGGGVAPRRSGGVVSRAGPAGAGSDEGAEEGVESSRTTMASGIVVSRTGVVRDNCHMASSMACTASEIPIPAAWRGRCGKAYVLSIR